MKSEREHRIKKREDLIKKFRCNLKKLILWFLFAASIFRTYKVESEYLGFDIAINTIIAILLFLISRKISQWCKNQVHNRHLRSMILKKEIINILFATLFFISIKLLLF